MRTGLLALSAALSLAAAPAFAAESVLPDGTVRFQSGSKDLTAESERTLDRLAKLLLQQPELNPVVLVGHADDRGNEELNRSLSLARAEVVRQSLLRRGLAEARVKTRGAGAAEPLSRGVTDDARALNRRVEVWVSPRGPVAKVTRVHKRVESREAAAPDWQPTRVNEQLRRYAKVRTLKQSASEVTFQEKDRVSLGPNALVVIYDSPAPTAATKRETADVEVDKGSIFASLAAREGRSMWVATKAGRVNVESKRTRVAVSKAKKQAAVSVFDGRSSVSAKGKSVSVVEGFGTRVVEGKPPEEPTPLPPPPPEWKTPSPQVMFAGEPLELTWTDGPGSERVEVQIADYQDPRGDHPFRLWRVRGGRTTGGRATAGAYALRLAGVDARGITGAPGRALTLVSLPPPGRLGGDPMPVTKGVVHVPGPAVLTMPVPKGLRLELGEKTSTAAVELVAMRPGLSELPLVVRTSTGALIARGVVKLQVATATITVVGAEPADEDHVLLRLRVRAARGAAVEALQLVAGEEPAETLRLVRSATVSGASAPLVECFCAAPTGATMVEHGGGEYVAKVLISAEARARARAGRGVVPVRVFERRGGLAAELWVPVSAASSSARAGDQPSGLQVGLHAGALLSGDDTPRAEGSLELGGRFALGERLTLDLGAEGGWLRRYIDGQRVDVVPIGARAALGLRLGAPRVYLGGFLGAAFASADAGTVLAARGFLGAAYGLGHVELGLEGGYLSAGTVRDQSLGGFELGAVLRFGTWSVAER